MNVPHDQYEYVLTDQDRLVSVKRADGSSLALDESSEDVCQFLTWAANEPLGRRPFELRALPEDAFFTSNIEKLVGHCKAAGILLTSRADGPEHDVHKLIFLHATEMPPELLGNALRFKRLRCAKAAPVNSAASFSDSGVYGEPGSIFVTNGLFEELKSGLGHEDSEIRKLSAVPVERTFVYFDVSDFSKYPSGQQALIINALTALANRPCSMRMRHDPLGSRERSICIGDGYIFVFTNPVEAVIFAAYLAARVERDGARQIITRFHFRVGVHSGPVFRFWDGSSWNYVGSGINEGARIVEAIGREQDDVVFISSETRDWMIRDKQDMDIFDFLQNRGRRRDKHSKFRRVYEVSHDALLANDLD